MLGGDEANKFSVNRPSLVLYFTLKKLTQVPCMRRSTMGIPPAVVPAPEM
ncbi:hypothetical protein X997_5495 [Burkholderia pseudomallei A79C]|nr:hypothetical protein X997_5495 [Burkholderia pseudomallei A79C]